MTGRSRPDLAASSPDLPEHQDRRYFAHLVIELERRIDVNAIRGHGLKLWPLIRWELARDIKSVSQQDDLSGQPSVRDDGLAGGAEERKLAQQEARAQERARYPDPQDQIDAQGAHLRAYGPIDYLLFSKIEKYYQPAQDSFYAPIIDPMYEDLSARGRAQVVAMTPLDIACWHEPLRVSADPYMRISGPIQKESPPEGLPEAVAEINAILADLAPDYAVNLERLVGRLNRYRRRYALFRDVLTSLQPGAVFCSSFTGWAPLIWAARDLGIPTVDIQHGGQSPYHYVTTHWTQVPEDGYELLPDFFWVWGQQIHDYIRPWLPGGASRHIPLVGGNRFIAKMKKEPDFAGSRAADVALGARCRDSARVVLVTLGYSVEDILSDHLLGAIQATPSWLWLLRLHPINRGERALSELRRKITEAGIANVEYDHATRQPLYSVLARSDVHVTGFSTTVREALTFGVPSVVTHPIGRTYFADEIAQGLFEYADTQDGLITALDQLAQGTGTSEQGPRFIETDDSLVDRALARIHAHPSVG
jgi:glycosyltransferase involved in cell wall biosynthesis